jgi:Putative Actinobacterial Holin-X, holin superfamily III
MMRGTVTRWVEVARSVGLALLEVLAAEAAELKRDLRRSGRELRGGLVLLALAAGVGFWTIGLGLWVAVELLSSRMSVLGATLVIFGLGLLGTLSLVWLGRRRLRRVETPVHALKRRSREHMDWWRESVVPGLAGDFADDPTEGASERSPDGGDR